MSDLIDRQAAITLPVMPKEHREYQTFNLDDAYEQGWNDLQKCIESLPSAQPKPQWIPVSERLPEDGTEVFVYLFNNPKSPYIAWIEDSRWYTEEFEVDREYEPLAWMPLPEPWEGEEK